MPSADPFRRILLLVLTVVIVARPLASGEDPGQLSDFADSGGMVLTFLTFLACAGWAIWRVVTKQSVVYIGLVELCFAGVVALYFVGTTRASYGRPAFMLAWEWLGYLALLFLARQLAARPGERQALLAVVMASLVALCVDGLHQQFVGIPRAAQAAGREVGDYVKKQVEARGYDPSPLELHQLTQRLEKRQVYGPYFHPASFATVLVLVFPLLVGACVTGIRSGAATWQTVLTFLFIALAGFTLLMTGNRLALVGMILASLGLLAVLLPVSRRNVVVGLLLLAVVVGGIGGLVYASGYLGDAITLRDEVWPTSWKMLSKNTSTLWLGVGPEQYRYFYPRYLEPTASIKAVVPESGVLQVWADVGLVGVILGGLSLFFLLVNLFRRSPLTAMVENNSPTPAPQADQPLRWEFYAAGMIGLVVTFILRAGALPADEIIREAILAGLRSVVWFAAFAVLESVTWSEGEYSTALSAGVLGMILVLLVQSGVGYPSVASLGCVAMGLLLAGVRPAPMEWLSRQAATTMITIPLFLAGTFGFFAFVFYSTAASQAAIQRAQLAGSYFFREVRKPAAERLLRNRTEYIRENLIDPLQKALADDPDNVRLLIELAAWYGQYWALEPDDNNPNGPGALAFRLVKQAQKVCPEGPAGYLGEFDLHVRVATMLKLSAEHFDNEAEKLVKKSAPPQQIGQLRQQAKQRREASQMRYQLAGEALMRYLPRDPLDPTLNYRYTATIFESGNEERGRELAKKVQDLDEQARSPRSLSDRQRGQLDRWIKKESSK